MNTAKEWERSDSPQPAVSLPEELEALTSLVEQKPQSLVAGDVEMQAAALDATKFLFDRGKSTSIKHVILWLNEPISGTIGGSRSIAH